MDSSAEKGALSRYVAGASSLKATHACKVENDEFCFRRIAEGPVTPGIECARSALGIARAGKHRAVALSLAATRSSRQGSVATLSKAAASLDKMGGGVERSSHGG
jgi:hypothetical protein